MNVFIEDDRVLQEAVAKGELTAQEYYSSVAGLHVINDFGYTKFLVFYAAIAFFGFSGLGVLGGIAGAALGVARFMQKNGELQDALSDIEKGLVLPYLPEKRQLEVELNHQDFYNQQATLVEAIEEALETGDEATVEIPSTPVAPTAKRRSTTILLPVSKPKQPNSEGTQPMPTAPTAKPFSHMFDLDPSELGVATAIAENIRSMILVGQPGAGKGFLLAYSLREVKRLHPEIQIWAIDPKGAPSEAWYWDPVDQYLPLRVSAFSGEKEVKEATAKCDAFLKGFIAVEGPKLLVIDEALALKQKAGRWFKQIMIGFNTLCSMGRESQSFGWIVSQSPNCEDFGISGGVRNAYRRVLVVASHNLGLLTNGSTFFDGKPSDALLNETGRVYFDSLTNTWGVIPHWGKKKAEPIAPEPEETIAQVIEKSPPTEPQATFETVNPAIELDAEAIDVCEDESDESTQESSTVGKSERPNMSEEDILKLAVQLEEWIKQHPDIPRKKWCSGFNAHKKGLLRPHFRYLLTLIENS